MALWTPEHTKTLLPSLTVMLLISILLRLTIGTKSRNIRMLPFQIIACILLLLEIGKQVCSFANGYDLYHIPLHYCSLFIFSVPAMAFYSGKHRKTVQSVTCAFCTALLLLMLIYPNLIYSSDNINNFFTDFFSFHTVAFHNLVMLEFMLILALDLTEPAGKGTQKAIIFSTGLFCTISAVMAQLLKTNYANFYRCNIPVFEALRTGLQPVLGSFITQLLYVLIVAALTILFTIGAYWVYRLLFKLICKKVCV